MTAIIVVDSGRGYLWAEADDTHQSIFIHQNEVKNRRVLHVGDRVQFDIEPNPKRPGQSQAVRVEYLGERGAL
jgi:cold shock CspA family protein